MSKHARTEMQMTLAAMQVADDAKRFPMNLTTKVAQIRRDVNGAERLLERVEKSEHPAHARLRRAALLNRNAQ